MEILIKNFSLRYYDMNNNKNILLFVIFCVHAWLKYFAPMGASMQINFRYNYQNEPISYDIMTWIIIKIYYYL